MERPRQDLSERVRSSSFLVLGGAVSIGQEVVRQIFARDPRRLHVVDLSENNLVELVRDLRSSAGYTSGDFRTLPLDGGSPEFRAFVGEQAPYDYVLNLSALKHVRSEKDPHTLMRMIQVNILDVAEMLESGFAAKCRKYFAVSSDKAVNPENVMGATKRVMELFLARASARIPVSTARFANVAFSDGSLLHGFKMRVEKRQPLSAPADVRRYFMTQEEAGQLCLLSCLLGETRDIFVPRGGPALPAVDFPGVATRYLGALGYGVRACASEDEARSSVEESLARGQWPCYFFASTTSGEKDLEELTGADETVDRARFNDVDVVALRPAAEESELNGFLTAIRSLRSSGKWSKEDLVARIRALVPEFRHKETGAYLDGRM
jgi:FlaA1/EpsC-like NDP-sugar epimerase